MKPAFFLYVLCPTLLFWGYFIAPYLGYLTWFLALILWALFFTADITMMFKNDKRK